MQITTKFNNGESVWYMENNRPMSSMITSIQVTAAPNFHAVPMDKLATAEVVQRVEYRMTYVAHGNYVHHERREDCLFPSKEALLESL